MVRMLQTDKMKAAKIDRLECDEIQEQSDAFFSFMPWSICIMMLLLVARP